MSSLYKGFIRKMKVRWSKYLLQIAIDVQIAWSAGTLVGAGRGSGVGFCLLNILGITQINPLREKQRRILGDS